MGAKGYRISPFTGVGVGAGRAMTMGCTWLRPLGDDDGDAGEVVWVV